eukprot:Amastigsp_a184812_6.p3 type:complete len:108 gc:universal Amastigsp_a184812_6:717-1040(+)
MPVAPSRSLDEPPRARIRSSRLPPKVPYRLANARRALRRRRQEATESPLLVQCSKKIPGRGAGNPGWIEYIRRQVCASIARQFRMELTSQSQSLRGLRQDRARLMPP